MVTYRSMMEGTDGLPVTGPGGRKLGVRSGRMPNPDVSAVADGDSVSPGGGGMSVAPGDPRLLPDHRRPAALGGRGRDPVWCLDVADLGTDIQFRQDSATHALLEPSRPMTLS